MKEKSTLKDVANNYLTHTKDKKIFEILALVVTIMFLLFVGTIIIANF